MDDFNVEAEEADMKSSCENYIFKSFTKQPTCHKNSLKLNALIQSLNSHSLKYKKILILDDFNVEVEEADVKSSCENYNFKSFTKQPTCHKNSRKLNALIQSLNSHSLKYKKILILDDFNVEVEEADVKSSCENYNFKSFTKQPTCHKNSGKPKCIDSILTNVPRMFQSTCVTETRLSDFHLMTVTVIKRTFKKVRPWIIYMPFRDFSNETFNTSLMNNLSNEVFS